MVNFAVYFANDSELTLSSAQSRLTLVVYAMHTTYMQSLMNLSSDVFLVLSILCTLIANWTFIANN